MNLITLLNQAANLELDIGIAIDKRLTEEARTGKLDEKINRLRMAAMKAYRRSERRYTKLVEEGKKRNQIPERLNNKLWPHVLEKQYEH